MKTTILMLALPAIVGCDDNASPVWGKQTGMPVNCRAYVQFAIDEYRAKKYSADESFVGLERNCGRDGQIWKDKR